MGQLVFQANAGGQTALVGPNPSTSISINIPATNGNMVTTGDSGTVTSTMLASSVYTAPGTIGSGTPNTGAFTSLSSTSGTLNGSLGATTPSTGAFTTLGASGVATFSAGTVSAPAITTTGDTNTGIFFPAADTIAFAEGGVESMRIDSSGNLGIGKANPSQKLDVVGLVRVSTSGTGTSNLGFTNDGGSFFVGLDSSTGGNFGAGNYGALLYNGANSPMVFFTNNAERMRITSDGLLQFNSGYGSVATAYGCRAWVNFNGTTNVGGNCTIRASGNVSSVADNGTGDYTVNFTTAMPDANYCFSPGSRVINVPTVLGIDDSATAPTASLCRFKCRRTDNDALIDQDSLAVSFFR